MIISDTQEIKPNSLINGDCLQVMPFIKDGSIDLILTDLPYGLTECKWDSVIPLEPLWEQYNRIIKENGAIVLTANQPFTSILIMSNLKMYKYNWVWDKHKGVNFATVAHRPFNSFEDICVFYKKQCTYNPQMTKGRAYHLKRGTASDVYNITKERMINGRPMVDHTLTMNETGDRYPLSIISVAKEQGLHPTQKPVELFEYLVKTYSNEGELVLDSTTGSATTAIACINTERKYICIEKDEEYYKVAINRINKHKRVTREKGVFKFLR